MFRGRCLEARLLGPVSRNKIRPLFGARQTGKTSLLCNAVVAPAATRLFDLADSGLRRRLE